MAALRKRWIAAVLVALAGLLLILVQTPLGFQLLAGPLVALSGFGKLEVDHGRLDLRGRLILDAAKYVSKDGSVDLRAEHVVLAIDVASLVGEGPIQIEAFDIRKASLTILSSPDPPSEALRAGPEETLPSLELPIVVQRLTASDFALVLSDGGQLNRIEIGKLSATNVVPGHRAQIDAEFNWLSSDEDSSLKRIGASLAGTLDFDTKGLVKTWDLRLEAKKDRTAGANSTTIDFVLRGDRGAPGAFSSDLELSGREDDVAAGRLKGQVGLHGISLGAKPVDVEIDVDLAIDALNLVVLEAFLPIDDDRPVLHGGLQGKVAVHGSVADKIHVDSALQIDDLEIIGKAFHAPSLKASMRVKATLVEELSAVEVDELAVDLGHEGAQRIHVSLSAPVRVPPKPNSGGRAVLSLTTDELSLPVFLDVVGLHTLPLRGGLLTSELIVDLDPAELLTRTKGRIEIGGLEIDSLASSRPVAIAGPVLHVDVETRKTDVSLHSLGLELGAGRLDVIGTASFDTPELSLRVHPGDLPLAEILPFVDVGVASRFGTLPVGGEISIVRKESRETEIDAKLSMEVLLTKSAEPVKVSIDGVTRVSAGGAVAADLTATQEGEKGKVHLTASLDQSIKVELKLANADLTALLQPFVEAEFARDSQQESSSRPVVAGGDPSRRTSPPAAGTSREMPLSIKAEVVNSRYRDVVIDQLAGTASRSAGEFEAKVSSSGISGGTLEAEVDLSDTKEPRIRWNVTGDGVELRPLMDAFAGQSRVDGRLVLSSNGYSEVPPPAPAIDGLGGEFHVDLRDGELEGFDILTELKNATGLDLFSTFAFSDLEGRIEIDRGVATIEELRAGGVAANISAGGTIDLRGDGAIDLLVNPRVGPSLLMKIKTPAPVKELLGTAEGLLSLPLDIQIRGTLAAPRYAVRPQSAGTAISTRGGKLVTGVLDGITNGGASRLLGAINPWSQDAHEEKPTASEPK